MSSEVLSPRVIENLKNFQPPVSRLSTIELELVPVVEPPPLSSRLKNEVTEGTKTSLKVVKVGVADSLSLVLPISPRVDFAAVVFP